METGDKMKLGDFVTFIKDQEIDVTMGIGEILDFSWAHPSGSWMPDMVRVCWPVKKKTIWVLKRDLKVMP